MNNVREVNRINEKELELAVEGGASWHDDYKDSAYIFVGNLDKRLTEGDVITIFSQYGEILDINLPRIPEGGLRDRNKDSQDTSMNNDRSSQQQQQQQQKQQEQAGKPGDRRGFGFLLYEDQRSTILAVDNLNGFVLLGRTIRVDHVRDYKMLGAKKKEEEGELIGPSRNAAPTLLDESPVSSEEEEQIDLADPMASYIAESNRQKSSDSKEDKEERRRRREERRRRRDERDRRRGKAEDEDRSKRSKRRRSDESLDRHQSSKDHIGERDSRDASYERDRSRYPHEEYRRDDTRREYVARGMRDSAASREVLSKAPKDDYNRYRADRSR